MITEHEIPRFLVCIVSNASDSSYGVVHSYKDNLYFYKHKAMRTNTKSIPSAFSFIQQTIKPITQEEIDLHYRKTSWVEISILETQEENILWNQRNKNAV